jgi:hypothetical protein
MGVTDIIKALKIERNRLDAAIAALSGSVFVRGRRGRPRAVPLQSAAPKSRRRFSAATRKRMAELMKARWAKVKESGKKSL